MPRGEFTEVNAFTALLTAESLFFAVLSVVVSLSRPGRDVPDLPVRAINLGYAAVGFLAIVALGALAAWWGIFAHDWPCSLRGNAIAAAIALAVVGQPIFAAIIVRGLRSKD